MALTAEMRRFGRAWKNLVAEIGGSVCCRPAVARAVANGLQPNLYVGPYLGHHARTCSMLIMTTDGLVKAAGLRRMHVENRRNVDSWDALRGLPWDVTERGADAAWAVPAPRPQVVHHPLAPRLRYVTRADLRKYGVTVGCAACSDIAVHGKTATPLAEECRTRIGEQVEHHPEGHERLQVHKRRRDAEPEVEGDRPLAVREDEADPAHQEQQDVEMPVEVSGESTTAKRGADAVADDEERPRLRLKR